VHINWFVKQIITPVTLYELDHTYISALIKARIFFYYQEILRHLYSYLARNTFHRHYVHQQWKLLYYFPHNMLLHKNLNRSTHIRMFVCLNKHSNLAKFVWALICTHVYDLWKRCLIHWTLAQHLVELHQLFHGNVLCLLLVLQSTNHIIIQLHILYANTHTSSR